jgi:hypothetical protein
MFKGAEWSENRGIGGGTYADVSYGYDSEAHNNLS